MLNTKFFTKVSEKTISDTGNDVTFSMYQGKSHPIVLKSKLNGRDLCVIQTHDSRSINCPVITKMPILNKKIEGVANDDALRYQVILGGETHLEFSITNLCHEGILNVEISRKKDDPFSVNTINIINGFRPFQTEIIRSDKTNSNREIIIKEAKTSEEKTVTVEEEEAKTVSEKVGDYLYITVRGQANVGLEEYFAKTYWATPDLIYVQSKKKSIVNPAVVDVIPQIKKKKKKFYKPAEKDDTYSWSDYSDNYSMYGVAMACAAISKKEENSEESDVGGVGGGLFSNDDWDEWYTPVAKKDGKTMESEHTHAISVSSVDTTSSYSGRMCDNRSDIRGNTVVNNVFARNYMPVKKNTVEEITANVIAKSKVGKIFHGDKVELKTQDVKCSVITGFDSDQCILGMSVIDGFYVGSPEMIDREKVIAALDEHIKQFIAKTFKDVTVFEEETCVMCLGDETNIVLMRCGHMCFCSMECVGNTKTCPLCHQNIVAKIDKKQLKMK